MCATNKPGGAVGVSQQSTTEMTRFKLVLRRSGWTILHVQNLGILMVLPQIVYGMSCSLNVGILGTYCLVAECCVPRYIGNIYWYRGYLGTYTIFCLFLVGTDCQKIITYLRLCPDRFFFIVDQTQVFIKWSEYLRIKQSSFLE